MAHNPRQTYTLLTVPAEFKSEAAKWAEEQATLEGHNHVEMYLSKILQAVIEEKHEAALKAEKSKHKESWRKRVAQVKPERNIE